LIYHHDLSSFSGIIKVRFRGITGAGFQSDMAIDDISIQTSVLVPDDVGVIAIDAPTSGCNLSATEAVTVRVRNFGTAPQSAILVSYNDGTGVITDTIAGPLSPGVTITYTFTATSNLSATGIYFFDAWTSLSADTNNANDSLTNYLVSNTPLISAFPYSKDFEVEPLCGTTCGTPCPLTGIWTNLTGSDDIDWIVDEGCGGTGPTVDHTLGSNTGNYLYTEASAGCNPSKVAILLSPCINISSLISPTLSFWYFMYDAGSGNMGNLYVDIDTGGIWTTIYSLIGAQQFVQTDPWLKAVVNLSAFSGTIKIRFRGITGSGPESEMAIDDINISDQLDVGVVSFVAPITRCNLTATETVTVSVTNFGSDTVTGIPLFYRVDGGAPVSGIMVTPLPPGATLPFSFPGTADLSIVKSYILDAWTDLAGDIDISNNNTANYSVIHISSPSVNLGPDSITVCDYMILDALNPGAAYSWSTFETTQAITVSVSNTYFVEVTYLGCTPVYDTIIVTVNPSPIVNLGPDIVVCFGTVLDATTGGATYFWKDATTNPTFSVSVSGTYWVNVTVSGCTTRDSIDVIIINVPPVVNLGPDDTVCGSIVLDAGNNLGAVFAWSPGGETTQTITVTGSGTYIVDVTSDCFTVFDTVTITVNPIPIVDLGNDTIICAGTLLLDATTGGATYLWKDGTTNPTFTVSASGTYWVTVTDIITGCIDRDTIVVFVSSGPTANFTYTTSDLTVTFNNTSQQGSTFFWDFGDCTTLLTFSDSNVVYTYANPGTYDVILVVTNPCDSDTITFTVTVTISGIDETKLVSERINIYPNPNEGIFTISFTGFENEKVQFTILDLQGRTVVNEQLTVNSEFNKEIDLSRLPKGMYFLRVNTTDKVFTKKILVE